MTTILSTYPSHVIKRDGSRVAFDKRKIEYAIERALRATGEFVPYAPLQVANAVVEQLVAQGNTALVTVEEVQDIVEQSLMRLSYTGSAKAFILYRAQRAKTRATRTDVPDTVRALAKESARYFEGNPLGQFVYTRTYARWIESEKRRETWVETVDRYVAFMRENLDSKLHESEYQEIKEAILNQEVMPSMRLMQFAGDPARRCNTCAYNCSFIAPTELSDFAEIMYLSMQGCGVGFSVESEFVEKLPQIARQRHILLSTFTVQDSKEGWCDALTHGLTTWYAGRDVRFDYSLIRPAGARLKTMGGKASGPEPLRALFEFARERIVARQGRRLRSIDVHDIICKIGECVVSGGVRRTAMISLSDLDDADLRDAKKGQFFITDPHRSVANNSAVYRTTPSSTELIDEWVALMKSQSGERGIFNRSSLKTTMPARRVEYLAASGFVHDNKIEGAIGTNPCGEILLQSKQFCNLSEVIARPNDTRESLKRKIRLATILGTYQSTLTSFRYISSEWTKNCEEERLLGVSVTGQWDSDAARVPETLSELKEIAVTVNAEYAARFGVRPSLAITAVKPSGTVSQTFNCSSGIHPRHAQYYVRRIRISATDSLFKLLKDQGVPHFPEVGQDIETATTYVVEFPVAAPQNATVQSHVSALEQLEYWRRVKERYTEHNPSATITIDGHEWVEVLAWIQRHWKIIGGLSFLPRREHVYRLAPYEEISEEEYKERMAVFPQIDYAKLVTYEREDETEQKREFACAGGTCELEPLPVPVIA